MFETPAHIYLQRKHYTTEQTILDYMWKFVIDDM